MLWSLNDDGEWRLYDTSQQLWGGGYKAIGAAHFVSAWGGQAAYWGWRAMALGVLGLEATFKNCYVYGVAESLEIAQQDAIKAAYDLFNATYAAGKDGQ